MNRVAVKTRFAPSPTGRLHVGNLRTALFNALFAAHGGGSFLLRIEDTDRERSSEHYIDQLMDDLHWLGIEWQEGPDCGGPGSPYRQSERNSIYQGYYDQLETKGLLYPCFCSQRELQLARKAQLGAGQPPRYPGTCAGLTESEVRQRLARGLKPVLRFRMPAAEQVAFDDLVRGSQVFATNAIGDFVVRRADGTPAFFFCNAVDDALMGVTHVLRGEDHLSNTPRQLLLLRAMGLPAPAYGHISLIVADDGVPLSKRHGSRSVGGLRESGCLPAALLNYLARLGHTLDSTACLDFRGLAEQFDTRRLGRAPARYDEEQLRHWQREAVAAESPAGLWEWLAGETGDLVPPDRREEFVELVRDNITAPTDAGYWARVVYGDPPQPDDEANDLLTNTGSGFIQAALDGLNQDRGDYSALIGYLKTVTGLKGKALFMPLRAALTGVLHGPELARLFALLPQDRIRSRLENCLARLAQSGVQE